MPASKKIVFLTELAINGKISFDVATGSAQELRTIQNLLKIGTLQSGTDTKINFYPNKEERR